MFIFKNISELDQEKIDKNSGIIMQHTINFRFNMITSYSIFL